MLGELILGSLWCTPSPILTAICAEEEAEPSTAVLVLMTSGTVAVSVLDSVACVFASVALSVVVLVLLPVIEVAPAWSC